MKTQNYLSSSKIFFTVVAIYFCNMQISKAQYHPLLQSNKYWGEEYHDAAHICQFHSGSKLFILNDTLLNGNIYKAFNQYPIDLSLGQISGCPPYIYDNKFGPILGVMFWGGGTLFMREDTLKQKIYTLYHDTVSQTYEEKLVYDFKVNVGDTFVSYPPIYNYQVNDSITCIVDKKKIYTAPNGEQLSSIELICSNVSGPFLGTPISIIEGIGSIFGMAYGVKSYVGWNLDAILTCVTYNGQTLYAGQGSWPQVSCYGSVDINEIDNSSQTIAISPNPNNGKFNLPKDFQCEEIKIYNTYGREIAFTFLNKNEIDISTQPTGLYFVKIWDGKKVYMAKEMKENY